MKRILLFVFTFFLISNLKAQQLISATFLEHRSLAQLQATYGPFMQWAVDLYKINYTTPDLNGMNDTASALVVVPVGPDRVFPLLCYQHGTVGSREDVPSNLRGGYQLAVVYGGFGFVAGAPDYLGLGDSRGFHPYVHAETEASAGVDMLFAIREMATQESFNINDQLFIMGYSQGGHAAAALHRSLEEDYAEDFTVTASAPMSGPYSISGEMKKAILSEEEYFFPAYLQYTSLSYNEVYGLYEETEDFFKQPYADMMDQFYREEIDLGDLNGMLIDQLIDDFGASITKLMIQDSVLEAVVSNENHAVNIALRDNDVYDWIPQAPTRLYYCEADEQVAFENSVFADSVMNAHGAADVMAINLDPDLDHGGCVEPAVIASLFFFSPLMDIGYILNTGEEKLPDISYYPNPVKDRLYLENVPADATYVLLDSQGKRILQGRFTAFSTSVDVSDLISGLYWMEVFSKEGKWVKKLVIQP